MAPKFYPESELLQRIELNGYTSMVRDKFSGISESYNILRLRLVLPRSSNVGAVYRYSTEVGDVPPDVEFGVAAAPWPA